MAQRRWGEMKNLAFAIITVGALCRSAGAARAEDTIPSPPAMELSLATKPASAGAKAPMAAVSRPSLLPNLALLDNQNAAQHPDSHVAPAPHTPDEPHLTESWWFWGAVAGVVVTTVAIVLIAGRPLEKPNSDLGDMRAFNQ